MKNQITLYLLSLSLFSCLIFPAQVSAETHKASLTNMIINEAIEDAGSSDSQALTINLTNDSKDNIKDAFVLGSIGTNSDNLDVIKINSGINNPYFLTAGIIVREDTRLYDVLIKESESNKVLSKIKNISGNRLFSIKSASQLKLILKSSAQEKAMLYAINLHAEAADIYKIKNKKQDQASPLLATLSKIIALNIEKRRDAGSNFNETVNIALKRNKKNKTRQRVLNGSLGEKDTIDTYSINRSFPKNTHLTLLVNANSNYFISLTSKKNKTPIVPKTACKGAQQIDFVAYGPIYISIESPNLTSKLNYNMQILEYPPDANSNRDAPDSLRKFQTIKTQVNGDIRFGNLSGRIGGADSIDNYLWTTERKSHLIVDLNGFSSTDIATVSVIERKSNKTIAEKTFGKPDPLSKPFLETYIDGPVLIAIKVPQNSKPRSYRLFAKEHALPSLKPQARTLSSSFSFFSAPKKP